MSLRLFNTLTRKKEELKPLRDNEIGLYTCGPTVYNFAHIGNLRTYIFEDILERTLEYNGYKVKRVMNITDVGHLTGDSDTGDDKLDKEAREEKKSVQEIAKFYTDAFLDDLKKLNIKIPERIAPATKYIRKQKELITQLFDKGFAYDTRTAVYFDVGKFKDYGKLSGQSLAEKSVGAREEVVVDEEKCHPQDFALWFKLEGKFKNHLLHWPSPWGEGFPGWHIECSAISRHFLGQPFDIHTGGVDHIGTHHTNEIAQSEAAYGIPLANIWMHGEHLVTNDAKMAKSEGNFITLSELEKKGYSPLVYRYFVLQAHYRTQLNFTYEALDAAQSGLASFNARYFEASQDAKKEVVDENYIHEMTTWQEKFREAINDDLNTPQAIAIAFDLLKDNNISAKAKTALINDFDTILKINLWTSPIPKEITDKFNEYEALRANKQFIQSDELRKEIESKGYVVRDTAEGSYIVKKFF